MKKFVITGEQTVRDVVEGEDREQAEKRFRMVYKGVKITSVLSWDAWNAERTKSINELKSSLKSSAEKYFEVGSVEVSFKKMRRSKKKQK